jgi:hypothetical protein
MLPCAGWSLSTTVQHCGPRSIGLKLWNKAFWKSYTVRHYTESAEALACAATLSLSNML